MRQVPIMENAGINRVIGRNMQEGGGEGGHIGGNTMDQRQLVSLFFVGVEEGIISEVERGGHDLR
jgi:hypothetical protein